MAKNLNTLFEDDEDLEEPHQPLNPIDFNINDINIKTEQQSGHYLIDMLRHEEINMDTPFQRSSDLWNQENMSRFIESMMLKFPIPPFYFDISYKKDLHGKDITNQPFWQVVDGLQRLSAIRNFIIGDKKGKRLKLKGLDFFKDLNNKTYDSLPPNLRRNIDSCQISLFLIYPNTPKNVKHRIFERVNTGGLKLNAQEIRHALNQGKPVEILNRAAEEGLVRNEIFIDPGRMKDHELALRYLAFQILGKDDYHDSMKDYLDKAMEELHTIEDSTINHHINNFSDSVKFILEAFGPCAFRKPDSKPINRALFDSYTWASKKLSRDQKNKILDNKQFLNTIYRESFKNTADNKNYIGSISTATARKENILLRFKVAESVLLEAAK